MMYRSGGVARMIGISRQWFHEKYLAEGLIVPDDHTDEPMEFLFTEKTVNEFLRRVGKPKPKRKG